MSDNPEIFKGSSERGIETSETAKEQLEKARLEHESTPELGPEDAEKAAEKASHEALEAAVSVEGGGAEKKRESHAAPVRRGSTISKAQKNASFKKQMKEIQTEMSAPSRAFSKVIHNKAIEKTSEVVGATIARPNAILSGAVFAFILTLAVYVIAKNIGYALSGFETIGAFIIGWVVGILYDYLRVLITGKPS